jgi:lactate permease
MTIAVTAWRIPVSQAVAVFGNGFCFGLFPILWIVVNGLWLYNISVESGDFDKMKATLTALTPDHRLQSLLIAFAFGSFLEATVGFGTPVAITVAMLIGLGFEPMKAALVCLLANTVPGVFSAIGIPLVIAARVTGVEVEELSRQVGKIIPVLGWLLPLWLTLALVGWRRTRPILPTLGITGTVFAASLFLFSHWFNVFLAGIATAVTAIICVIVVIRQSEPQRRTDWRELGSAPVAWRPYLILAALIFLWADERWLGFKPLLQQLEGSLPLLSSPGTAVFFACLVSVAISPKLSFRQGFGCLGRTVVQLGRSIATISTVLGLAYLMNFSGMSAAIGQALTSTGRVYPFFSPLLGWLGAFLTGGVASSNALFGVMQTTAAAGIGIDPLLTVAANSAGAATGKMVSAQSLSVLAALPGLKNREGEVFQLVFAHSLAMVILLGIVVALVAV